MTAFTLAVAGQKPIAGELLANLSPRYSGFRCLHQPEGGYGNPDHMPIVRPSVNIAGINFTEDMQLLSYRLNAFNVLFTGERWRSVYRATTAFTNSNGFDRIGDPRADYVNRRDLSFDPPRLMRAIICGGMFIRGDVVGDQLVCWPGIQAIDGNKPMPSVAEVMEKNWYFAATTRNGETINNFPQGVGKPVLIPYILREPARYPIQWFTPWNSNELPDPLRIYL